MNIKWVSTFLYHFFFFHYFTSAQMTGLKETNMFEIDVVITILKHMKVLKCKYI